MDHKRTYKGIRTADACLVWVEDANRVRRRLSARTDLWHHSDAFEWGYAGAGAAQLALAILADHLVNHGGGDHVDSGGRLALGIHHSFKFRVVASLPRNNWSITSAEIDRILASIVKDYAAHGHDRKNNDEPPTGGAAA